MGAERERGMEGHTFGGATAVPDPEDEDGVSAESLTAVGDDVDGTEPCAGVKIGLPRIGAGSVKGEVTFARRRARAAVSDCTAVWMAEIQRALSALSSAASTKITGGRCCLRLIRNEKEGFASKAPSSVSSTRMEESIGC